MRIAETRKEDILYFQGPFWIIGSSIKEIKRGKYELLTERYLSNFEGDYIKSQSKSSRTHKNVWNTYKFKDIEYDYFPRGRVSIYKGTAFIHIHSLFNQPDIIDNIIKGYQIQNLDIEIEENDTIQGSHYDFKLN